MPDVDKRLRGTTVKMSRQRRAIAAHMLSSLHVSAQLTTVVEADVTDIFDLTRKRVGAVGELTATRVTLLSVIAVAALRVLRAHPVLNASVDDAAQSIVYHDHEHLSLAVDTEQGLSVPVIHEADRMSAAELASAIDRQADRARSRRLEPCDLQGGTFTITNTGSRGALFDTPIINQPQVAILGLGAAAERPAFGPNTGSQDREVVARRFMHLCLSYDHRIVDGADAARYLSDLKHTIESPELINELLSEKLAALS